MKHTLILRNPDIKETASRLILGCPLEPLHEVVIREHKKDRTAAQNALLWLWYTVIAGELGETKDDIHYRCKGQILVHIYERDNPEYAKTIGSVRKIYKMTDMKNEAKHLYHSIVKLTSTTTATVEQFTEYLNDIEKDCIGKGIVLPHPEDRYYEAMGIKR